MNAKQLIQEFFDSKFHKDAAALEKYLHPDFEIYWNSSAGYSHMDKESFSTMLLEMSKSFESIRFDITHMLEDNNAVTVRYTYHVRAIENPEEEIPMAHFISIFEVEGEKILKAFQISQPAEESLESMKSFLPNNIE